MPVIRVSNEAYQKLLTLQAKDGNAMSIFMDRLMAKVVSDGSKDSEPAKSRAKSRAKKRRRKRADKDPKWVAGIVGLTKS